MSTVTKSLSSVETGAQSLIAARSNRSLNILVRGLDGVGTVCLWAIIFVVPLTMAGIRETGVALFVASSLLMALTWAMSELITGASNSTFSRSYFILLAGVCLVALQLTHLPQAVIDFASPFSGEYLEVWNNDHVLLTNNQQWSHLSFTPSLTRSGLVLLLAYSVFFVTLTQKLRTLESIDDVLRLIAISAVLMATVALGQLFFGNGRFLWVFEHPFRTASWPAKGTFTNQNHLAHFLALGVGPLVWWWKLMGSEKGNARLRGKNRNEFSTRSKDNVRRLIVGGLTAVVLLTGLLSLSRGGICAILIASSIAMVAMGKKLTDLLKLAAPVVTFVVIAILVFGTEAWQNKWNSIARADSVSSLSEGRFALWAALLDAFPHFWLFGSGVGSHAEVYPIWLPADFGVRFSHAESGYFQVLIEAGIAGLLLVLAGIGCAVYWVWSALKASGQDQHRRARVLILSAGLAVTVSHSFVDFVWYIPACMIFTTITLACLFRTNQLYQPSIDQSISWPSNLSLLVLLVAFPVGSLSADVITRDMTSQSSWSAFRLDAVAAGRTQVFDDLDGVNERLDSMIANLEECIQRDPHDHQAMSELATMYLSRFESLQENADNPMSLREIKNTVESSGFESPQDVYAWLKRAFGEHVVDLYRSLLVAEKAIKGQPLKGENYLVLAQVAFLKGISESEEDRLIAQAVRLRPYSAPILYVAGLVEAEKGDIEAACKWWKRAFHLVRDIRPRILRDLQKFLPPAEIVKHIEPGPDGLWDLFESYKKQGLTDHQVWTATFYTARFDELKASADTRDSFFWCRSAEVFESIENHERATKCLGQAVKYAPRDYQLRKNYAFKLVSVGRDDTAQSQLEWCRLKSPADKEVLQELQRLARLDDGEVLRGI